MQIFDEMLRRAASEPFGAVMTITPEMAFYLLSKNLGNRKLRAAKMKQFSSDIRAGRWAFNGEPIIISVDGQLNDGQHRLAAIIDADREVVTSVMFGVDRASRFTLDQGAPRGAGDHLGVMGVSNPNETAKAARLLISYDRHEGSSIKNAHRISATEVVQFARAHDYLAKAVSEMSSVPRQVRPAPLSTLSFWRILVRSNPKAVEFLNSVAGGENVSKGDIAYLARLRLLRGDARSDLAKTEIFLRGLNAFLRGETEFRIRTIGELPTLKLR